MKFITLYMTRLITVYNMTVETEQEITFHDRCKTVGIKNSRKKLRIRLSEIARIYDYSLNYVRNWPRLESPPIPKKHIIQEEKGKPWYVVPWVAIYYFPLNNNRCASDLI